MEGDATMLYTKDMKKVLSAGSVIVASIFVFLFSKDFTTPADTSSLAIASNAETSSDSACVLPTSSAKNEMLFIGCGGYLE